MAATGISNFVKIFANKVIKVLKQKYGVKKKKKETLNSFIKYVQPNKNHPVVLLGICF